MRIIIPSLILGLMLGLVGCSSIVKPKTTRNVGAPPTKADQALLVVMRPRGPVNTNLGAPIIIDGKAVGKIAPNTFMYTYLNPGQHTLQTKRPEAIEWDQGTFPTLQLNLQAGKAYYYLIEWVNAPNDGNFFTSEILNSNDWIHWPESKAHEELADVANSPTDEQYEQLKASGQWEFKRDRTAR